MCIHPVSDNVFEHGHKSRKSCKRHEQEERRTANSACRHLGKHIRKRCKNKSRTSIGLEAKSKASRNDDEPRNKGDPRIQNANVGSFRQKRMLALDIATENAHGTDTDTKRKEGLSERRKDNLANPRFLDLGKIRQQVELETFTRTWKRKHSNRQNSHNNKERRHHHLRHAFHATLESKRHDRKPGKCSNNHPEHKQRTISEHFTKLGTDFGRSQVHEIAHRDHTVEVIEHPSRHRRIEHHQKVVRDNHRDTR